jgi:light-regulated signal transduction histidine kinase (bacteriophytochrome)
MRQSTSAQNGNKHGENYCEIFVEDHYNEFHSNIPMEKHGGFIDTSLGLDFCQKIMERHKGNVCAKGKMNQGVTYVISLPIAGSPVHNFVLTETSAVSSS